MSPFPSERITERMISGLSPRVQRYPATNCHHCGPLGEMPSVRPERMTLCRGGGVHIVHRFAREKEKSKLQQTSRCPCSSVFVACPSTGAAGSHNQNTSTRSFPIDTPTCAPYFGDTAISRPSYVCILLIRLPTNTFVCHGSILNLSRLPRASRSCPCAAFCTRRVWGRKWRRAGGRRPD